MYLRVYGRATSARTSNADFQMMFRLRTNYANNGAKAMQRKRVGATCTRNAKTKSKEAKYEDIGYVWRGDESRAARRGLETRQRCPEFRRGGKSAGKIHGSLCRTAVWQIVCVYKTHFTVTVPTCRARLFLARFHSRRRETRAEFVSEK